MKKRFFLSALLAGCLLFPGQARADEGMWLPIFIKRLNYVDMQKHGLQLTPEEIYSINNSSLKDAVPIFGNGCSSEMVSANGLVLTNHHCGFSAIADLSTPEHDYLHDGFYAPSMKEELPAKGLTVTFFVRMEDVTNRIQEVITPNMTEDERYEAIEKIATEIEQQASEDGKYRAEVKSFYKGNEYYLFVYQVFRDIRLVCTPPYSIGKFGGETDNWMWPRHTCDFSMFRIYADKDNNPADYSEDNVPYRPKEHFTINIGDKKEGDFCFIMGYPGTTQRYLTSWGIDFLVNTEYPAFVDARDAKLNIMREAMAANDTVRLNYASSFASTSNYWKNRIGMIDALTKNKTADKKRGIEAEVAAWIEADPVRKAVYGDIFQTMQDYYAATAASTAALQYLSQAGLSGSTVSSVAWQLGTIFSSPQYSDSLREAFIERLPKYYERLDMNLEKRLSTELMKHIVKNVPDSLLPAVLSARIQEIGVDSLAAAMETSLLFCPEKLQAALKDDPEAVLKDPAIEVFKSYYDQYLALNQKNREIVNSFNRADRLFHAALQKAFEGRRVFYPDANFTMRLTYGNILPYDPKDGVTYHYETTLDGVAQKYKKGDPEFDAPQKLLDLNAARDYGQYANSKGQLITCFLSNLDITGGNSGSPVINGRGELIGIAFDGNWEAMSGDIEFEPNLQRTISVDIRYVLFVIDKVMGAQNILDELTIVNVPQDTKLKNAKAEKPEKVKKAKNKRSKKA